jgi:two-component system sensor histidine kinase DesK
MHKIKQIVMGPWLPPAVGRTPYLWLFCLVFLGWKYFYVPVETVELVCLAATIALFLPIYFASYHRHRQGAVLCVLVVLLMGVMWAPYNHGASTFFIYAAAMCGNIVSTRRAYLILGAIIGLALLVGLQLAFQPFAFLIPALVVGGPIGLSSVMDARLRHSRVLLMRKQEEVEHMATIAERERISRDLHDLLGHTLSMITLKAELAGKLFDRDPVACRKEIKDIEETARHALSEVRTAVSGYRASGLAQALTTARASLAAASIGFEEQVEAFTLPPAAEHVLALALREAVTNIVRHAGATHCALNLSLEQGVIVFRIVDDGATLKDGQAIQQGNGLTGMRERVAALGGTLALRFERGLALELTLPMGAAT